MDSNVNDNRSNNNSSSNEVINKIINLIEYNNKRENEEITITDFFTPILARIERIGVISAYKELKIISELATKRSAFFEQLKVRDWIDKNIPHYRYTFTDIDCLASYKNRLMLLEYKFGNEPITENKLPAGQRITFKYLDSLLKRSKEREAIYEGFYIITLDNMDIDNAKKIFINTTEVSIKELKDFLSFKSARRYESLF